MGYRIFYWSNSFGALIVKDGVFVLIKYSVFFNENIEWFSENVEYSMSATPSNCGDTLKLLLPSRCGNISMTRVMTSGKVKT